MRVVPHPSLPEARMAQQLQVACFDTPYRIEALTYTLSQLARVEEHGTLHTLAIQLLVAMISRECDALREIVRPNEDATVR